MATGISLCMMVKDEESFIEKCILSVQHIVDDIVIVDTGSSDRTVDICKKYASRLEHATFEDDFSSIRNRVISMVQTPWILFLDADEEFTTEEADKLPGVVAASPSEVYAYRVYRYNFFSTGGWYSSRNVKLLRNCPGLRYSKRINESVDNSIVDLGGRVENAAISLNHFGHCRSVESRNTKADRYIRMMYEQLRESPNDAVLEATIGLISRTIGDFQQALGRTESALASRPELPILHLFRGHVLRSAGRLAEAEVNYREAFRLNPSDSSAINMIGVIELSSGRFDDAIQSFDRAYELEPLALHTLINKGLTFEAMGDYQSAIDLFSEVATRNPGFLRNDWTGRVECDPYRVFYYETIFQYAGLAYHLSYCRWKAQRTRYVCIDVSDHHNSTDTMTNKNY